MKNMTTAPLSIGDILEGKIVANTVDGRGILRYEGFTVFVNGAIVGETVKISVKKVVKNFAEAQTIETLSESSQRKAPSCEYYGLCGGCCAQHMSYEAQLNVKREHIKNALRRIGGFDEESYEFLEAEGMKTPWNYRNKAEYVEARGFLKKSSHNIVDINECPLQHTQSTLAMRIVKKWAENRGEKLCRLITRVNVHGEIMIIIVIDGKIPDFSELTILLSSTLEKLHSVHVYLNSIENCNTFEDGAQIKTLFGEQRMSDTLCGMNFLLSPQAFFQINREQTEKLYKIAANFANLSGKETLLDAYCGIGAIGLTMAHMARRVIGVENIASAVCDARLNAAANGIENVQFFCGKCENVLPKLIKDGLRPDVAVFDPPRHGCEKSFLEAICEAEPKKIVYISCDPATQARDCKLLAQRGYALKIAAPVDMFPWTEHVECVVGLQRVEK